MYSKIKTCVLLGVFILTSGCATNSKYKEYAILKSGYIQKSKLDNDLIQLEKEMNQKLKTLSDDISAAKNDIIKSKDIQIDKATDGLYGADAVKRTIINPTRTDIITNNFVQEAWSALGNRVPSYHKIIEINSRLTKELDEKQTSIIDLKKTHDKVVDENQRLVNITKTLQDKSTQLQTDIVTIKTEYESKISEKYNEIKLKSDELLKKEAIRADDAKTIQAMKEKITMILGGFALAALAGAIWSPVFKSQLGIFAAILGFAAIGVWYVTQIMVWMVFGVAITIIVVWAIYKHSLEKRAAVATYAGLEDIKKTNPLLWKQISPIMTEWQSQYIVNNDIITTVPDHSISKHIDSSLMEANQK